MRRVDMLEVDAVLFVAGIGVGVEFPTWEENQETGLTTT
jgi:hypothetical protein